MPNVLQLKNFQLKNKVKFLKAALQDYKVGALTPSSKFVVRRILKELNPEYKFIVEYGAGDGVITKEILKILPRDGRLVAIELNGDFIGDLRNIEDERLIVIHDDVNNVCKKISQFGLPKIDVVISGIPFSLIKPKIRREIIKNTYNMVSSSGRLIIYQTSPLMLPHLKRFCGTNVRWFFEPRNLVPYFIMVGEKN
ncbi:hypothetical protein HYV91_02225 [Candidatus Wolfebacteria bacterium]|nr:hypothetical protein [Candidatus Wolfebacteria bacterium]